MPEQARRPILSIPLRSRADAIGKRGNRARSGLLWLAALWAPLALRAALLVEQSLAPGAGDLRGACSDASVALGVAFAIGALARWRRWAGVGLLLVWLLLCYGNYEHVRANGANLALRYAGYLVDPTFLLGSALAVTRPWLLVGAWTPALAIGWAALRAGSRARLLPLALGCALTAAAFAFWRASPGTLDWRQSSFAAQNASRLVRAVAARDALAPPADPSAAPGPERAPSSALDAAAPDLAGEPVVAFGSPGTNVLLVMLEGVSGAYVESIAEANDRRPIGIRMPELDRIARNHVFFTSFIAQQRQTNRGEYALLCGELPRLLAAEAKMAELASRPDAARGRRCLPAALAEAGYATVYLQAAPMTFMLKDKFMPTIGFAQSIGDEYFEAAYSRNKWGVDDRTFLQQSLRKIEELRGAGRPWFLTLLTAGTHHPLNIPREVARGARTDRRRLAFGHLDRAAGEFVAELEARGVLDDTLVLLTSDESQGWYGGVSAGEIRLTQNWGFLIAMLPGGAKLRVDAPFAQLDIPPSILDWLGLADLAHGFSGRSVFRRYARPRALGFANTYAESLGGVREDGLMVLCVEEMTRCVRASTDDQRLFKAGVEFARDVSADDLAFLRALADASMPISDRGPRHEGDPASHRGRELRLSEVSSFEIRDDVEDLQWVFGGQYLSVPANSRIDVDLEVEVAGEDGRVEVEHALKAPGTNFFIKRITGMRPGDRFHFRYSYATAEPLDELGNYLIVTRLAGSGLRLELPSARMRIQPASEIPDPPLVVDRYDIEFSPRPDRPTRAAEP